MRKIIVTISDAGAPEVNFQGAHITKRELSRAVRAIELGRREQVREFRRKKIIKQHEISKKELNNDKAI